MNSPSLFDQRDPRGITLVEVVVVIVILAVLSLLGFRLVATGLGSGRLAASTNNLRMLAAANLTYAADHGTFCPATDRRNLVRWHGSRNNARGRFDPTTGTLSAYLGDGRQVIACPKFQEFLDQADSWELGSGGYGYNAAYLGRSPEDSTRPLSPFSVRTPARTLMFATTAFAKNNGIQEYPFAEPYRWVDPNWRLQGELQPSIHFRFKGRALIAWCDGHLSLESPKAFPDTNFYGGDNEAAGIGFLGPTDEKGYWNPRN